MRDRGFPVKYLCAPDEGHGFRRPVNNLAMHAAMEKFLAKHLGGRFQEGGTPEVMARLKEITVDPKTVTLVKKSTLSALPIPAADLGTFNVSYTGSLAVQGQNMPLSAERTIKEDGGAWVIEDSVKLPMGTMLDTTRVTKGSLVLLGRAAKQGPVTTEIAFKDGKATGSMAMGGESKPITFDVGTEILGEHDEVYARLPLADGYSLTFKTFDLQKQKTALRLLKVVDQEELKGQKTWKITVTLPRDLDGNNSPGTRQLTFEELMKASKELTDLIETFTAWDGTWVTDVEIRF